MTHSTGFTESYLHGIYGPILPPDELIEEHIQAWKDSRLLVPFSQFIETLYHYEREDQATELTQSKLF